MINECGCVDITGQRLLEPDEPGHGCHLRTDSVLAFINLLDNLPVDDETWREIIEEPYG